MTPLDNNLSSAAIVVGPFAPSAIILQLNLSALLTLTVFSNAAGIKMSHY